MKRFRGLTFWLFAACAVFSLAACSSTEKEAEVKDVPELKTEELPDDLKERFEIAEFDTEKMAKVREAERAEAERTRQEARKAKKKKEAAPVAPVAFEYPDRRTEHQALWVGEKQTYELTYFGVAAGLVTMEIKPFKVVNERKVYHIAGLAETSRVFSVFYRVNDSVTSFLDYKGIFSHRFHILIDESKQTRDTLELFDSEKAESFYWDRWNHHKKGYSEEKKRSPIPRFPLDAMSALYWLRVQPLVTGNVYTVPVVSEGKTWEGVATVLGRESIDTDIGTMKAIKIRADMKFEGALKSQGENIIFLSDDNRRILLYLEAKVKIGKVKAVIKSFTPGSPPE